MKKSVEEAIKSLADEAYGAESSIAAMQYSQAALNLSHVLLAIDSIEKKK